MKNRDNIMPAEKFNPPTEFEAETSGSGNTCFVYDARSWRNKNKPNQQRGSGVRRPVHEVIAK